MRIVFDPRTLRQSKMGSVTAIVYFDFGADRQFPVADWNDFVVVIAGWWLEALQAVERGQVEAELRFMDGPYWITAIRAGASLQLRCIEDRGSAAKSYEASVDAEEFRRELMGFVRDVAAACVAAGIQSPDLAPLKRFLPN